MCNESSYINLDNFPENCFLLVGYLCVRVHYWYRWIYSR